MCFNLKGLLQTRLSMIYIMPMQFLKFWTEIIVIIYTLDLSFTSLTMVVVTLKQG